MPVAINPDALIDKSPCLYHVTYSESVKRIKEFRRRESAAVLMTAGQRSHLLRQRREHLESFWLGAFRIVLTDQRPIIAANICFQDGWTIADLIEAINRRVFFWRGSEAGLLKRDRPHFIKYDEAGHSLTFLRLSFLETIRLNSDRGPEVCKYNSGAARMNNGKRIPRGPRTFVEPRRSDFGVGKVREVVFREFVELPMTTEFCQGSWRGPWKRLFHCFDEE
jgi:hypothetical protein